MPTKNLFRLARILALGVACAVSFGAAAECRQSPDKTAPPGRVPEVETGSPHGTPSLDCLKYVGSIQMHGVEHVLVRDDQGTIHRLKVGDAMGGNGGIISRIDDNAIYITRHGSAKGGRKEAVVKFPKK